MRKLLSIALLFAFLLPLLAPALALGQDAESRLPACCRRSGAHHCNGRMTPAAADGHHHLSGPRCPQFPHAVPAVHAARFAVGGGYLAAAFAGAALPASRPSPAHRQSERDRSRSQRGPPQA